MANDDHDHHHHLTATATATASMMSTTTTTTTTTTSSSSRLKRTIDNSIATRRPSSPAFNSKQAASKRSMAIIDSNNNDLPAKNEESTNIKRFKCDQYNVSEIRFFFFFYFFFYSISHYLEFDHDNAKSNLFDLFILLLLFLNFYSVIYIE
jgi:hypothetical protein